jgi:hypothetical protein
LNILCGDLYRFGGEMRSTGLKSGKKMDKCGLVSLKRFIRIVTDGGTSKEIDALWNTILDDHKKHDDCGFWRKSFKTTFNDKQ